MHPRLNYAKAAPEAYRAVVALDDYVVRQSGLPPLLIDLIKLRASQINGCAYCVDKHSREARAHGASEQWINLVVTWRESPLYTPAERAVLGWTEALTLLADTRAPDADFEAMRAHFSDEEITKITVAIGLINVWNRLAVGFRSQHPIDAPMAVAV
ncbi:MAG TPA: carboxymuconolactone decarboxylase family protein [Devosiaceae bacterium]|jgi:AhpD family alkylhydroperoxidase|nr:carboxymuconolactone decarboxylase family protein [Devosiaceae bacterium]